MAWTTYSQQSYFLGWFCLGWKIQKEREPCWINTVRSCKCVCGKCIYKLQNRVQDQILPHSGLLWVLWTGAMVDHDMVRRMLDQAATRAQRHAELESATTVMERLLNVSLSPEMLPWGSACRYLILFRKKTYHQHILYIVQSFCWGSKWISAFVLQLAFFCCHVDHTDFLNHVLCIVCIMHVYGIMMIKLSHKTLMVSSCSTYINFQATLVKINITSVYKTHDSAMNITRLQVRCNVKSVGCVIDQSMHGMTCAYDKYLY